MHQFDVLSSEMHLKTEATTIENTGCVSGYQPC